MIQLYAKKKVEIVVEASRAPAIIEMIEAAGATGHTILPEAFGKGNRGARDEARLSDVFRNVLIIVVTREDVALQIVEESQALLEHYAGVVFVSDVQVVRDEHF